MLWILVVILVGALYFSYRLINPFVIKSQDGETHFKRWKLFELPWFGIYIHKIYQSDKDLHAHSHPWDFASFVLKGEYCEWDEYFWEKRRCGWLSWNSKKRHEFHKLELDKPVWSLFFRGKKHWTNKKDQVSDWGYWVEGELIHHQKYRQMKRAGELDIHPDLYVILED